MTQSFLCICNVMKYNYFHKSNIGKSVYLGKQNPENSSIQGE